jgi:hypothetical protein
VIIVRKSAPLSAQTILVALIFGGTAFALVSAGLTVPIPGTAIVSDPREIFATIGSALTGPLGGLIVGALAGVAEPSAQGPAVFAHCVGSLWLGFAYRRIICEHLQMPAGFAVWALFVFVYYYVFLIPGFALAGFASAIIGGAAGVPSPVATYVILARGALPEATITAVVTTVALAALPRWYRRPLW